MLVFIIMGNQFELFGKSDKPTEEALHTGPAEQIIVEKSLAELEADFQALTGFSASNHGFKKREDILDFLFQYGTATQAERLSVLAGRSNEEDSSLSYLQR
jgi:hypothetical protein